MEENVTLSVAEETAENVVSDSVLSAESEGTVPAKKHRKPINQQKLQDNLWGWIFCVPLIIGTVWFVYIALIMAVLLSFTNYTVGHPTPLFEYLFNMGSDIATQRGLTMHSWDVQGTTDALYWYKYVFTREVQLAGGITYHEMGYYLFNTVFYMIGIPIGMILSVFFAVCMSRDIRGGNLFRVLYYLPCVASSISVVYTFKILFDPNGMINQMLGLGTFRWMDSGASGQMATWNSMLGKESTSAFMLDPFWCQGLFTKLVIIIMSVWKGLGGTIILYVAGLSGVNAATKEAAEIDGANGWQIFWKITMPDLYPTIFYNIVTSVIGGMQIYAEPVLLQGESYISSGYVSLIWAYGLSTENSFNSMNAALGTAYGMVLAIMIFFLTLFQFWLDSRNKD